MIARINNEGNRALLMLALLLLAAGGLDAWQSAARRAGGHFWLDDLACATTAPLQGALLGASRRTEAAWAALAHSRRLEGENARLAARVTELEAELSSFRESSAEAERGRALRSAYAGGKRPEQTAQVIAMGLGGWLSYFTIDRGSAEGVRRRDVALTRDGVVGQVYAVAAHSARVLPITDPVSGVAVRVQRSREAGVLKGLGQWRCEVRYLGPQAQVRAGDDLVTAGTGGVFPKGLRVGRVTAVVPDPNTSGKIALVEPAAKLQNVEEVLLVHALLPEE